MFRRWEWFPYIRYMWYLHLSAIQHNNTDALYVYVRICTYQFALGLFAFVAHSALAVCRDRQSLFWEYRLPLFFHLQQSIVRAHTFLHSQQRLFGLSALSVLLLTLQIILLYRVQILNCHLKSWKIQRRWREVPNRNSAAPVLAGLIPD